MKSLNTVEIRLLQLIFEVHNHHRLTQSALHTDSFLEPLIDLTYKDLAAYVRRDPAAKNDPYYVLDAYLTFKAVLWHRVAHALLEVDSEQFMTAARAISEGAKAFSGIEIHPSAQIGSEFVVDHGYGVVIGETAIVGHSCYFLNGVVLGASGIADNKTGQRHPQVGNGVEIAANAKLLGPILIGDYAKIGADCRITDHVDSHTVIYWKALIETYRDTLAVKVDSVLASTDSQYLIFDGRNLQAIDVCSVQLNTGEEIAISFECVGTTLQLFIGKLRTIYGRLIVLLKRKGKVIVQATLLL